MHRRWGSMAGLAAFGSASSVQPPEGFSQEEEEEAEYTEGPRDVCATARWVLCESLALSVVLREPLPAPIAQALAGGLCGVDDGDNCCTPCISTLCLGLAGAEEGGGGGVGPGWLVRLPVMVGGRAAAEGELLAPDGVLGPGTAAVLCATSGRTLSWRVSENRPAPFEDWRALLQREGVVPLVALVTVPLLPPGSAGPALGAATFGVKAELAEGGQEALQELGASLACSIQHQTKALWEESLGFLTQVIPPRVVQRMLSAALMMGPLQAAAAAAPLPPAVPVRARAAAARPPAVAAAIEPQAAPPAAPSPRTPMVQPHAAAVQPSLGSTSSTSRLARVSVTVESSSGASCGGGAYAAPVGGLLGPEPATPNSAASTAGSSPHDLARCAEAADTHGKAAKEGRAAAGEAAAAEQAGGAAGSQAKGFGGIEVKTLRQKWNLEYADPNLEDAFKGWFNMLQTQTDLAVFRYFSVLMLALLVSLVVRGGTTAGDMLAVTHGLMSVAVLGAVMLLSPAWYILHRSTVVASVRIISAALLLIHVYLDPAFYSGSLLKGLAGSCSFTLVVNSFRNRLRFSNHLLVQLAKLYLCANANAFTYTDPARASHTYLPLLATTLVQMASALLPSLAVYCLESGLRRKFLAAGMQAGLLQLPTDPTPVSPAAVFQTATAFRSAVTPRDANQRASCSSK